ncbi:hypothetical protein KC726_04305 [Candidatus Woesebacteria bacterium]|nr:hypothetical protein [Candidatus Woesebacteria bacterium]
MHFFLLAGIVIFIAIVLILFSFTSSTASPIPYFPTNTRDMKKIIDLMDLKNDEVMIDFGAGDGGIIFRAAQRAYQHNQNTKFVAVEINTMLCFIMNLRRIFHLNRKNIYIVKHDMFVLDYPALIASLHLEKKPKLLFYLYISPWFMPQIGEMIKCLGYQSRAITYFYPIAGVKESRKYTFTNAVYSYNHLGNETQ